MKQLMLVVGLLFAMNVWAAPVNVNTDSAEKIAESLNGVGLVKAKAIVQYRQENGPFKRLEDLSKVKGIGPKTIEKNKQDIILSSGKQKDESKKNQKDEGKKIR